MDRIALGRRVLEAREAAGMTQDGLGGEVGLDRSAISRLESGERKLSVPELVSIAAALRRPLAYFVSEPVPAVISRRRSSFAAHDTTPLLDAELQQFAGDVRTLLQLGLLTPTDRPAPVRTPADHVSAERMAAEARKRLDLPLYDVPDLGRVCQRLGLVVFAAPLGEGGADGGCVEVADGALAASVVNGDAPPGRRRMTVAHELGHWLCGDAYDVLASTSSEQMISSFAIHFLAPRPAVAACWEEHDVLSLRDRALAVAAQFRISWSAAVGQLTNLEVITREDRRSLIEQDPRRGDYLRLGLTWPEEFRAPYLSPDFTGACLNGYSQGILTSDRVLELLRGALTAEDLPRREPLHLDDLRRSFRDHDG